jgi:hypothetical protein
VQFYTHEQAFSAEVQLYNDPALRALMPARHEVVANSDGSVRSPSGFRFPPCVVLERGESLDEVAANVRCEFIIVMQVLCQLLITFCMLS